MAFDYRSGSTTSHPSAAGATGGTPGKRTLVDALPQPPAQPPAIATSGSGAAMPREVQGKMERAFGADFSGVRIHQDGRAQAMNAIAYTQGEDLHFQPGRYDPTSRAGQELLGHELTHVVQQRAGRVSVQAKDSPINADPALEREADAMGARAARGEPVGGAPAPAGPVHSAVIQRYAETEREGKKWRVSDQGGMTVEVAGGPGSRSKMLYASPALVAEANAKLSAAGSFIRLEMGRPRFGGAQVEPRYVGPHAEEGKVYDQPGVTHGSNLVMPSDCNNSARLIMGVEHSPVVTDRPPDDDKAEVTVGTQGRTEVRDARQSFDIKPGGSNLVESGGLSQLTGSAVRYRTVIQDRVGKLDAEGVKLFLKRSTGLAESDSANVWPLLHDLQNKHPAIYRDFTGWAGLNEAARPRVGDALVTYLPDGKGANQITRNDKAYEALVEVLRKALGGDEVAEPTGSKNPQLQEHLRQLRIERARRKVAAPLGGVISEATQELAKLAHTEQTELALIETRKIELAAATKVYDSAKDRKVEPGHEDEHHTQVTQARLEVEKIKSAINAIHTRIRELEPARNRQRGVKTMTQALVDKLADSKTDATELAKQALALIGIKPDTAWSEVKQSLNQDKNGSKYFGGAVDQEFSTAVGDNDLWNKHWGGVVMTEGGDYVTLENDASTEKHGAMNTKWGFALYGSEKTGQSFHDQMMASGDFGNFAATARFTGPRGPDDKAQRGRQYDQKLPDLSTDQKLDLALSQAGDSHEQLLEVLQGLGGDGRAALKKRYATLAPVHDNIRKLILRMIDELAGVAKPETPILRRGGGSCGSEMPAAFEPEPPSGNAM